MENNTNLDGTCFFCGNYVNLLINHEEKVHGINKNQNLELF